MMFKKYDEKSFLRYINKSYIYCTLVSLRDKKTRKDLWACSKKIAKEINKSAISIIFDTLHCCNKYGVKFAEYYNFSFQNKTEAIRKTYISTFFNYRIYNVFNDPNYRNIFLDKIQFNKKFNKFIGRKWIAVSEVDLSKLEEFLKDKKSVVLKAKDGNSGNDVEVCDVENIGELIEYIKVKKFDIVEERLFNHRDIAVFNPNSLNTIRVVTFGTGDEIEFLYAGLRVGCDGAKIDNISQGGVVASIDIETGKISTPFFSKKNSAATSSLCDKNYSGYQIPLWEQVIEIIKEASKVIPQIQYIAWDVAITEQGIALVEGNNSFGSVIMQAHLSDDQEGLRLKLLDIITRRLNNGNKR